LKDLPAKLAFPFVRLYGLEHSNILWSELAVPRTINPAAIETRSVARPTLFATNT
jgi:hypothetical protein